MLHFPELRPDLTTLTVPLRKRIAFAKERASCFLILSCPADLVFDPTLAFARFTEDLLLRYAMIAARTPARQLTWILSPVPGLDFQPQT